MVRAGSGETEFQGQFLGWIKGELTSGGYDFEDATQEFPNTAGKRSDVILWNSRAANYGFLEIELKTPKTPLTDSTYQADAIKKARLVGAQYIALFNMRDATIFRTPEAPQSGFLRADIVKEFDALQDILAVEDWIKPSNSAALRARTRDLVLAAHDLKSRGVLDQVVVDATVFVDALKAPVRDASVSLAGDFRRVLSDRRAGRALNQWASEQGLTALVSDLSDALGGQLAYRITGQVLFYYGFRRHHAILSDISLTPRVPVLEELRRYWDVIRTFDYEALFEKSILEDVVLSATSERLVADLVRFLASYDWSQIQFDVLGRIFEELLPITERIILGQYYTPYRLADLLLSLTLMDEPTQLLDPAVGSGTFLLRTYDRLRRKHGITHEDALGPLWGTDISAFAAELAVINLCGQDLSSYTNYPKILVRDFFRLRPRQLVNVAAAKPIMGGSPLIDVKLPTFQYIVGNPPFVRSQQLDDLDVTYKQRLHQLAGQAHVDDSKFDAFAYFLLRAVDFLAEGGRLGFVTSAAWLTTGYGARLQRFLLDRFKVEAIVFSRAEPFFPYQEVNTVVVILEKRGRAKGPVLDELIRFVALTERLEGLFPTMTDGDYWNAVDLIADDMLRAEPGEHRGYTVATRSAHEEYQALTERPTQVRNWALPFRESDIYRDLFGESRDG